MRPHSFVIRDAVSHIVTCSNRSGQHDELAIELLQAITEFEDREDCFNRLKEIGAAIGCGHYNDKDGRLNLVQCVEVALSDGLRKEVGKP